jgi:hypothetical protein
MFLNRLPGDYSYMSGTFHYAVCVCVHGAGVIVLLSFCPINQLLWVVDEGRRPQ